MTTRCLDKAFFFKILYNFLQPESNYFDTMFQMTGMYTCLVLHCKIRIILEERMKYLMLDTNIYIDMVVSRNDSHKPESYKNLKGLLDTGEINLIVPQIVIEEAFRHFDSEIEKLLSKVQEIKKLLTKMYWVNNTIELEKFNSVLRPAKESVNELIQVFEDNQEKYKIDFKERLNYLFEHKNSIILTETQEIMYKANQRNLYKKRPFHYNDSKKNSLPDAVIIETLINIKTFDQLIIDLVVFISRNPADFSVDSKTNKERLHDDILNDIKENNLIEIVKYSTLFTKTLLDVFSEEIQNANLTIQFETAAEEEAKYEEKIAIETYKISQIDHDRELGGLPSLSADYEDILSTDLEITEFMDLLQKTENKLSCAINEYVENCEELRDILEDKKTIMETDPFVNLLFPNGTDSLQNDLYNVIISQSDIQLDEDFENSISFSDSFHLNSTLLKFIDLANNQYSVIVEGDLSPDNQGMDILSVELLKNGEIYKKGSIELHYGFMNFDDNQAGEGQDLQIIVYFDVLLESLEEIGENIVKEIDFKNSLIKNIINKLNE